MPDTEDPTLSLSKLLKDPSKWIVRRKIASFKPHEALFPDPRDPEKKIRVVVTDNDLTEITRQGKDLEKQGIYCVLYAGHRKPGAPQSEQPPIVGYGMNPRKGTFGPNNEPCVLYDYFFYPDKYEMVQGLPFRSAEYIPALRQIRGVSIQKTDPQLNLGMVFYEADHFTYHYECDKAHYGPVGVVTVTDGNHSQGDDEMTDQEKAQADRFMQHYLKQHPWMAQTMAQYSAQASGTNVSLPGQQQAATPPQQTAQQQQSAEQVNFSNPEMTVLYQMVSGLSSVVAENQKQMKRVSAEAAIDKLISEDYNLEREKEVAELVAIPYEQWATKINYIKQFHEKLPTGGFINVAGPSEGFAVQEDEDAPANVRDKSEFDAALKYTMQHVGISFEDAVREVRKKRAAKAS